MKYTIGGDRRVVCVMLGSIKCLWLGTAVDISDLIGENRNNLMLLVCRQIFCIIR